MHSLSTDLGRPTSGNLNIDVIAGPPPNTNILGKKESVSLPASVVISLAQTRGGSNPIQSELTDSIKEKGLDYPPTVVLLGESAFSTYLSFTQTRFGEERILGDFRPKIIDAYSNTPVFPLIVDGHSRQRSIEVIQSGAESPTWVEYIIDPANTPEEIVALQLRANIQARPSKDKEALSIASAFEFSRFIEPVLSKAEFTRRMGIGAAHLRNALYFAELPASIQKLASKNGIPFTLGVELGRRKSLFNLYHSLNLPKNSEAELERAVELEMSLMASKFYRLKSVKKVVIHLKNTCESMQKKLLAKDPDFINTHPGAFSDWRAGRAIEMILFDEPEDRLDHIKKRLEDFEREVASVKDRRAAHLAGMIMEIKDIESARSSVAV